MITEKRLRLRALERADMDQWMVWLNDPEVMHYFSGPRLYPYSRDDAEAFLRNMRESPTDRAFSIETLAGAHLGTVGLHRIDWQARQAELGILIGEKQYWGMGYGSEAIRAVARFAGDTMNLRRLWLRVVEYNGRAIACYRKCGFEEEGRLRQHIYRDGRYWDDLLLGILLTPGE